MIHRRMRLPKRRYVVVDERVEKAVGLSKIEDPESSRVLLTRAEAKGLVAHLKKGGKSVRAIEVGP